jgi:nucleoside-diphosphate-sugar epimerase
MEAADQTRCCAITGASGYVGGRIAEHFARAGWRVVRLGRGSDRVETSFRLGEPVSIDALRGCSTLVHCAYDFTPLGWKELHDINVLGTERLFEVACAAGIQRIVLISTISAFEGCRSLYGRAKLETERIAQSIGARVIRPGLVYGPGAGGMLGRLVDQARLATFVPIPAGGPTVQYLLHHDDLAAAVLAAVERTSSSGDPVTVANQRGWPLRDIMVEIGRALDRRPTLVPIPWQFAWAGLRTAEALGLRLAIRSDSLLSMIYQNPSPNLNAQEELGVSCRAFAASSLVR